MSSYVYLMRCGNYVKIGKSNKPRSRVNQLQSTGTPDSIELLDMIECETEQDALWLESRLHKECEVWNTRGEWFSLAGPVLSAFYAYGNKAVRERSLVTLAFQALAVSRIKKKLEVRHEDTFDINWNLRMLKPDYVEVIRWMKDSNNRDESDPIGIYSCSGDLRGVAWAYYSSAKQDQVLIMITDECATFFNKMRLRKLRRAVSIECGDWVNEERNAQMIRQLATKRHGVAA